MRPSMSPNRRGRWQKALSVALVATGLGTAGADGRLGQQQPVFRTGVEIVAIDVNVVDRQARPVEGLKPEDFTVTVDRKPRRIASAQYINHGVRLVAASGRTPARKAPADIAFDAAAGVPPAQAGRNVMIVVDTDSLEIGSGQNASRAARRFLDELPETDRVGVATVPRLPSTLTFASDRAAARKALEGIITAPAELPTGEQTVGLQEAYDIEKNDPSTIAAVVARECRCAYAPESTAGSGSATTAATTASSTRNEAAASELGPCTLTQMEGCVTPLLMFAHQTALTGHMQAQRTLDALRDLGQSLAQVEGPKTVVLVTGGLGIPETSTSFDPLEPALATGQVTLYTLYIEQMSLGQVKRPVSPSFAFDDRIPRWGIENVTAAANGTLVHVVGTVESAFDRVATEMSGSYLLGIEVEPGDRDGRSHDVNVKVNRTGVEVRARKRYVIQPERPGTRPAEPARAPLSAVERAARRAERVTPVVPTVADMTSELMALLGRAGEFVLDYQPRIAALACDEQYDQTLSKWRSGPVVVNGTSQTREDWFLDKRRRMRSDYLLVAGTGQLGWQQFRDPFEVDGSGVHARGRLEKLFVDSPATALQQAAQFMTESARYNLGFGERNMDVPTLALVLLLPVNRARFSFRKEAEMEIEGTPTWQVTFFETGTPTIFGDQNTNMPLEGRLWIEPTQGRIVRSALRLNLEEADAEIGVTYRPSAELGGLWVPSEMQETYTSDTQKVDCLARYSNFRLLKRGAVPGVPK